MSLFRPTSTPAQTSLIYITIGCLTIVWSGVWYIYLLNHPSDTAMVYYWVSGFAFTGLTLVVIGLAVGQIGRSARHAESTPVSVLPSPVPGEPAAPVAIPVQIPPATPAQGSASPLVTPQLATTREFVNTSQ